MKSWSVPEWMSMSSFLCSLQPSQFLCTNISSSSFIFHTKATSSSREELRSLHPVPQILLLVSIGQFIPIFGLALLQHLLGSTILGSFHHHFCFWISTQLRGQTLPPSKSEMLLELPLWRQEPCYQQFENKAPNFQGKDQFPFLFWLDSPSHKLTSAQTTGVWLPHVCNNISGVSMEGSVSAL